MNPPSNKIEFKQPPLRNIEQSGTLYKDVQLNKIQSILFKEIDGIIQVRIIQYMAPNNIISQ